MDPKCRFLLSCEPRDSSSRGTDLIFNIITEITVLSIEAGSAPELVAFALLDDASLGLCITYESSIHIADLRILIWNLLCCCDKMFN